MPTHIDIPGPTGTIEASVETPEQTAGRIAVLAHPHPQYGGSMHDAVLDVLARQLLDAGTLVVRFNFRGVGGSDGHYDNGRGEADDLLAVVAWAAREYADSALLLGGYSFGAAMTWRACTLGAQPQQVLLLAPPVGTMAFDGNLPDCPVEVFAGEQDEFIDPSKLAAWQGVTVHQIAGANHFFSGRINELAAAIRATLSQH